MKQEPPDGLIGFKGHDLDFVVIGVVPPPERDFVVFELHEPVIADRDPVGVSAEILKNVLGFEGASNQNKWLFNYKKYIFSTCFKGCEFRC